MNTSLEQQKSKNNSPAEIIYSAGHGPYAEPRPCAVCERLFAPPASKVGGNNYRCCSLSCASKLKAKFMHGTTPESTKAERVRANGLVNSRIRDGKVKRPTTCVACGKENCKTDAHHPDYSQPDLVAFLCRSCHMKAHRHRDFEQRVAELARHARQHGFNPRSISLPVLASFPAVIARGERGPT